MSSEQKPSATDFESEVKTLEEQISETLNNIQLSHGRDDFHLNEDDAEGDVENLEDVLGSCDEEYKSLFATLDQLGSCLDEVENRNDSLNTRVDDLLTTMAKAQEEREASMKKWTTEANTVMDDLNRREELKKNDKS